MEFLKETLGDALYAQVEEALKGSDIKLANIANGEYVARRKYDDLNGQLRAANADIADRDTKLAAFQSQDIAGLQRQVDDWKKRAEDAEKATETFKFDSAITAALTGAKARNVKSVRALLDENALSLDENGALSGLDDQLAALKKDNGFLFEPEGKGGSGFSGLVPPDQGGDWKSEANAALRASVRPE